MVGAGVTVVEAPGCRGAGVTVVAAPAALTLVGAPA